MVNDRFYARFEGEPEIDFTYGIGTVHSLKIWVGYFETILDSLFYVVDDRDEGLIKEYTSREGWYENSPWPIPDVDAVIRQLMLFNNDIVSFEVSESIRNVLPDLVSTLVTFLQNSQNDKNIVYIYAD